MLAFVYQNGGSLTNVTSPAVAGAVNFYVGLIKSGLAADADQLGVQLVRPRARPGQVRDHLRGQLAASVHEVDLPEDALRRLPMVQGKKQGNLAFTVSYSMAKDDAEQGRLRGRCSPGSSASRARRSGCRRASRFRRATT